MKPFKIATYAVLSILVVVFAAKTFLYGGNQPGDPNDSPLYDSTLQRALTNFKKSDLLLGRDSVQSSPSYPPARNPGYNPRAAQGHQQQKQPGAATYVRAGVSLFQKGEYDNALIYLNAASMQDPTNAQALQYLAATYTKLGKTAEAQEATRKLNALRKTTPGPQSKPR